MNPSRAGYVLGYAGLLPFVAALVLALLPGHAQLQALGYKAFLYYGAVILSFLGGVRWGAAMRAPSAKALSLAVAPSLIAFLILLLPSSYAIQFNALLFLTLGTFDVLKPRTPDWPLWYRTLRTHLTGAVVGLHAVFIWLAP